MYERYNDNRKHRKITKSELVKKGGHNSIGCLAYILICMGLCTILTGCGTVKTVNTGDTASGSGRRNGDSLIDNIRLEIESTSGGGEAIKSSTRQSGIVPQDKKSVTGQTDKPNKSEIDKIAYAVAMAETGGCKLGYGKIYNNCVGLKNGKIAPCKKIGKNKMCIYDKPEESIEAFKKVWIIGYGGGFPTKRMAEVYSGNDHADTWLKNVTYYFNQV
jgi:hypothetical protein